MKVSVITVNFNNLEGLKKTYASVISQKKPFYEFIVIDGASTDGGAEFLSGHAGYIDYYVSEPDKGIYNAMNKGIDHVRGDYCIFMNSGDIFHSPDVLEAFCSSERKEDIICGDTMILSETPTVKKAEDEMTLKYLFNHAICHQSAFIRSSLMKKYRYDESLKIVADRKFFLQALILDGCSYSAFPKIVADYDVTGFSSSNRFASKLEYGSVLEQLIPGRILEDYGRSSFGALYGLSQYEAFFMETMKRNYRKAVYSVSVLLVRFFSLFRKSARYSLSYPVREKRVQTGR